MEVRLSSNTFSIKQLGNIKLQSALFLSITLVLGLLEEVASRIRTAMLGGPILTYAELESWERDVTFPAGFLQSQGGAGRPGWRPDLGRTGGQARGTSQHDRAVEAAGQKSLPEVFAKKTAPGAADRDAEVKGLQRPDRPADRGSPTSLSRVSGTLSNTSVST